MTPDIPDWSPPADVGEARRSWEAHAARWLNQDLPGIGALHEAVPIGPNLTADIMMPAGPPPFPVVLYLHGGGWAFGSPRSFRKVGMTFAANGFAAVMLDYRLAPEHPFPSALDDVRAAIDWIGGNEAQRGFSGRIAIGGDSAGANLALAAAIREPDSFRAGIAALLLLYGVYDLAGALVRANNHPGLVLQVRNYIGNTPIGDPLVSPMFATFPTTLPPCLVMEGGADPFVGGEAAALAARFARAGVPHELQIVPGMPHGFLQQFGRDGCERGWRLMIDFLRRH